MAIIFILRNIYLEAHSRCDPLERYKEEQKPPENGRSIIKKFARLNQFKISPHYLNNEPCKLHIPNISVRYI